MLDDEIAIVTGGSTGIGKAIARKYLKYGTEVVIGNRSEEAKRETAAEFGCDFRQCDVSDYEPVQHLVERTIDEYDRLDAMLNNAGIGRIETPRSASSSCTSPPNVR